MRGPRRYGGAAYAAASWVVSPAVAMTLGVVRKPKPKIILSSRPKRARKFLARLGRIAPRDRETVSAVIARSACDEAIHTYFAARWIASRSLSSGAHSRDPLARNDGVRSALGKLLQSSRRSPGRRETGLTIAALASRESAARCGGA